MPEIYTPDEIAEKLKVSEQTIRRYLREKKLEGFKLGNTWRITEKSFLDFIEERSSSNQEK
ncbi:MULTISPECIES: helix-turn-helix domain-containing protein [Halanaerobium]|jgi:excisionase family DNA binding protein|uniref:DNA binding domain-containing protein, excisionase family n=2 Tax=Halanaerobium TaxID=2330 RepID=A0A1G8T3K2_9FIRM|nr:MULTISPECIES: helix-turn-helix domain-containing protein [Halanaerobium]SDJ36219.1 DNA binding domain-containing protein, excisionase family [Halanaerobium congolense]SET65366.1 DNA binding domain-containing protein, excisionase family [Halanaerobium congolense]SIR46024.1 DNA binding domain-containing protein, excisionase family [Halanaerobium kushneri]